MGRHTVIFDCGLHMGHQDSASLKGHLVCVYEHDQMIHLFPCIILSGAGQDIGKSCVVVTVGRHTVMFDCGLHMGHQDERRFPDFSFLQSGSNKGKSFDELIDCVIVTHL